MKALSRMAPHGGMGPREGVLNSTNLNMPGKGMERDYSTLNEF